MEIFESGTHNNILSHANHEPLKGSEGEEGGGMANHAPMLKEHKALTQLL